MNPERDQQIMNTFLGAAELSGRRREAYLRKTCATDQELRNEVDSLLIHHKSGTLIAVRQDPATKSQSSRTRIQPNRNRRVMTLRIGRLVLVPIAVALGLALFWYLANQSVSNKLRTNVEAQLQSILGADVAAIEHWMAKQKQLAETWASHPNVIKTLDEQARRSREERLTTSQLEATKHNSEFLRTLSPLLEQKEVAFVGVFAKDGHAIAKSPTPSVTDIYWSAKGAGFIAPCFQGETVFIPSFMPGSNVVGSREQDARPEVSFVAPVRDQQGDVFAAMQFNMRVDQQFGALFSKAHMGETGESFAFDGKGTVLTNLRFEDRLANLGLIPSDGTAALNLQLRDPGFDLRAQNTANRESATWPLCKVPATAIAAGAAVNVDGYRNYLGAEVVGAAKWLPKYQFGIAREMEYAEAYAPLASLGKLFQVLFGLFVLSVISLAIIAIRNWWLRRKIVEARMLGQYTLGKLIGDGGMGRVYLANHALLRRPTAIKLIDAQIVDNETIERFEREVQLASELTHANTIQIYDYGRTDDGVFYYAMEYLPGMTLADLVARQGPLPPARAICIIRQICASLGEAHQKGLVHRDIKPANIMICERGGDYDFVKVLDFGLVKQASGEVGNDITNARQLSGTPLCIAPERIREPSLVDPRSDIYSVGTVAFFLLTGNYPFDGDTSIDVLYQIINGPTPRSLQTERPDVPAMLDDLILQCLARDPIERPACIIEIKEVLDSLAADFPWSNEDAKRKIHLKSTNDEPAFDQQKQATHSRTAGQCN